MKFDCIYESYNIDLVKNCIFIIFQVIRYANSYKLDSEKPFSVDNVTRIIKNIVLDVITDDIHYNADDMANKAKSICGIIREKVKEENYER